MQDLQSALYEMKFRLAYVESTGNVFQALFSSVMEMRYPGDFARVRPWGNVGDRKNDGYLRSKRQLFQCYAPREMSSAICKTKIKEDFAGALPYWKEHFDEWVFTHNDKEGLPPDVLKLLLDLTAKHAPITATHWGYAELLAEFKQLTDSDRDSLFGPVSLQHVAYGKGYSDLAPFPRSLAPPDLGAPGFELQGYQQAMCNRYSRLKLEELDPTPPIRHLTLTETFIPQSARECAEFLPSVLELPKELQQRLRESGEIEDDEVDEEKLVQYSRAYFEQSPRQILELLSNPALTRLVILGDPGSGKSTLLQYLLLRWAEKKSPDLAREPLPLLIELREYARLRDRGQTVGFVAYLHHGASVRWHFDPSRLHDWLRANPSLVLFDGLDEVFDADIRGEISTAIYRFADDYPRARVLVSSRVIGYQHQRWRDEGFRHFMLQDFDDPQIADFLERWHRNAYKEQSAGEAKRDSLARAITASSAIRQLARNPLLLAMMAILNRTQELPQDRAELYEQCARLLLHQWKVDLASARDPELDKAALDFKDKRDLILRVARTMQNSDQGLAGNVIEEETLERTLAEGMAEVPSVRPARAARALIHQLRGRNFILGFLGGRSYAFMHRAFLDYFCAVDIFQRLQTERTLTIEQLKPDIFGRWNDEAWHEALSLLAGMLEPRFVAEILTYLLHEPDPHLTFHSIFLAARCVGNVRKRKELGAAADWTLERLKALAQFRHPSRSLWEAAQGERSRAALMIRSRAVQSIASGWRDDSDVLAWLKIRAESDPDGGVREIAVREVSRGWKQDRETLPWLKARARSDTHPTVRQTALEELARSWKDDPETLPILKLRAKFDKVPDVIKTAVKELAQGWKGDPEILLILKARIQSGKHPSVQQTVIEELARGWKDDPYVLPMLKKCAQFARHYDVRQAALLELSTGWTDDPETLPLVRVRGESDESEQVRRAAVYLVTYGWIDDPDTLSWIRARARCDKDLGVRTAALEELARGWIDDPESWSLIKAMAQSDESASVRRVALRELSRGREEDPETLPIIKSRAESDEDASVRTTALEELVRGWKADPDTLPFIMVRGRSDNDWNVKKAALHEFARGWKDDPVTVAWLKARARSDEDSGVRTAALQELSSGWTDDPETLPLIKELAQFDEVGDVRYAALLELARNWRRDSDTLAIVRSRAASDGIGFVRIAAMGALARGWRGDSNTLEFLKAQARSEKDVRVKEAALLEIVHGWMDDPDTVLFVRSCGAAEPKVVSSRFQRIANSGTPPSSS